MTGTQDTTETTITATAPGAFELYKHRKGGFYRILGQGKVQTDTPLSDCAAIVVYQSEEDGLIWARPATEFFDGRFSPLPNAPKEPDQLGLRVVVNVTAQDIIAPVWKTFAETLRSEIATIRVAAAYDAEVPLPAWDFREDVLEVLDKMEAAIPAALAMPSPQPAEAVQEAVEPAGEGWRAIAERDREIDTIQQLAGVTLSNSYPAWVRDEDGRIYEAVWTIDDRGRGYWWDLEGESPVDPVEIYPHPLTATRSASSEGTRE